MRRLRLNPEPLKIVTAGVRAAWTRRLELGWRCEHEDGRGRCTSRDTILFWDAEHRRSESYCKRHLQDADGLTRVES